MAWWNDVGDAILSAGSTTGDVVEGVVDTVADTVEDVVEIGEEMVTGGADQLSEMADDAGGWLASVPVAVIAGSADAVAGFAADLVHGLANLVRDVGSIVGSILRLDVPGFLTGIADFIANALGLFFDVVRAAFGGYLVGGIVERFRNLSLRRFVAARLSQTFTGAELSRARAKVGLDRPGYFGLPIEGEHRVCMLDSANTDLVAMHNAGELDLYQMAGLLSWSSLDFWPNMRSTVLVVDDNGKDGFLPANRFVITRHLDSNGRDYRLRVYALRSDALTENIRINREKLRQLGVRITWSEPFVFGRFFGLNGLEITRSEYQLANDSNIIEPWLQRNGYHSGRPDDDTKLFAFAAFRYQPGSFGEKYGQVYGRRISSGSPTCLRPGRTDNCCNVIRRSIDDPAGNRVLSGAGVTYRDAYPDWIFKYVLTHECGHWLGLCHGGHTLNEFMFTISPGQGISLLNPRLLHWYMDGEPRFTWEDGRNAWEFIIDQMPHVLTA